MYGKNVFTDKDSVADSINNILEKEEKKAKKDYDGDGKVESGKDEVWGSRMKAAKKAGKMDSCDHKCDEETVAEDKWTDIADGPWKKSTRTKGQAVSAAANAAGKGLKSIKDPKKKEMKKEEAEQIDEISSGLASRYLSKTKPEYSSPKEIEKRSSGRKLALMKKWGDKSFGIDEPKVKATEEVTLSADLIEKVLTAAEKKKKEEIAKALKSKYGKSSKTYAIATAQAKKVAEEAEQTDEAYGRGDPAKKKAPLSPAQIQAMLSSNAPERKTQTSKDKKDHIKHTNFLARKYAEEVEQIDELSKNTLKSYVKKAADDTWVRGRKFADAKASGDREGMRAANRKDWNHHKGIDRALDRITKEEVEQIDELSKKTLSNYMRANTKRMADPKNPDSMERKMKRHDDYFKASDKFHKEAAGPTSDYTLNTDFSTEANPTSNPVTPMNRVKEATAKSMKQLKARMGMKTEMLGKLGSDGPIGGSDQNWPANTPVTTDTLRGREAGGKDNDYKKFKVKLMGQLKQGDAESKAPTDDKYEG